MLRPIKATRRAPAAHPQRTSRAPAQPPRAQRVVLYVGSANYHATAFLNGVEVGSHSGGHLPFHIELKEELVLFGRPNRLTVALNNTLTPTSVPAGHVQTNAAGRRVQRVQMDFFNYAGLHRRVLLYATPTVYLDSISVSVQVMFFFSASFTFLLLLFRVLLSLFAIGCGVGWGSCCCASVVGVIHPPDARAA